MARQQSYGFPAPLSRPNPAPIVAQRAPLASDTGYEVGQVWIDQVGNSSYVLIEVVGGAASWATSSMAAGTVATLTGNSGGAISPDGAGNISLVGTATNGINVAGAGNTLTASMQSPFVGDFTFRETAAGNTEILQIDQTDNTNAGSHSQLFMQTGGASGGDPFVTWEIAGAQAYHMGTDNSDVDRFKFGTGNAVGSATKMVFDPGGNGIWTFLGDQQIFGGIAAGFTGGQYYLRQTGIQIPTPTTAATVMAITLADPQTVTVVWEFSASLDPATEAGGGTVTATARRSGGGAVLLGAPTVVFNHDFAGAPVVTADVSGNDIRLRFTTGTTVAAVNVIATAKVQPLISNT